MTSKPFSPDLLARCISCGFCLPACPTYALTKKEESSPRGRITLMRAVQDGQLHINETIAESSFCLGCRACEPVCPAGVEYGTLLEEWREAAWVGRKRPLIAKALLFAVSKQWRVRLLGILSRHGRQAPTEVNLMLGCFERALYPKMAATVAKLAPTISTPPKQGCCGALHAHNGELALGEEMAKQLGKQLPGTIVTTAGGCAAHLAGVLGRDRVREFSQWYLEQASGEFQINGRRARVTYQDSCHLRNGLGVANEPRMLIAKVADFVELPGASSCCGAAGSYSLLQRNRSREILDQKIKQIEALDVDFVATTNPGCTRQLANGLKKRKSKVAVIHVAELLARSR